MIIRKINSFSLAKVTIPFWIILGFLSGIIFAFMGNVFLETISNITETNSKFETTLWIIGLLVLPIFVTIIGFITTLIMSWVLNLSLKIFGGINIEEKTSSDFSDITNI